MSEAFEDTHGLDKNSATDRNGTKTSWEFTGLANVTNTAAYTNLEIYLAILADDFQMMVDGIEVPDGSFTLTQPTSNIIRAHKIRLGTGGGGAYLGTNKIN